MDVALTLAATILLLCLIVAACALFTNSIEWMGHRFNLSEGAVGSVLAAVGTALPETMVPIVAILSTQVAGSQVSAEAGHAIGIGAILGAPFLLSTLAMFITGMAVLFFAKQRKHSKTLDLDMGLFRRDLRYFFPAYISVFLAGFIPNHTVKLALGIGLIVYYGIYVMRTLQKEHVPDEDFDLEPLTFAFKRPGEPSTALIMTQVLASLVGIIICAHLFVEQINHLSGIFHVDPMILSLIIAPIATEMPEKFNSVIWIRQGKDNLALGNITGAMVFQSCIPTAVGVLFTPWVLSTQGIVSVALCLLSSIVLFFYAYNRKHLSPYVMILGGVFYLGFLIYSLVLAERSTHHTAMAWLSGLIG